MAMSRSELFFPNEFTVEPKGSTLVYGNNPEIVDSTCSQIKNLRRSLFDVILQVSKRAIICSSSYNQEKKNFIKKLHREIEKMLYKFALTVSNFLRKSFKAFLSFIFASSGGKMMGISGCEDRF